MKKKKKEDPGRRVKPARPPMPKTLRLPVTLAQIRARRKPGEKYPGGIVPIAAPPRRREAARLPGGEDQTFPPNPGEPTHITFHGGTVVSHPPIQLLFWGSRWARASTTPSAVDLLSAAQAIVSGPLLSGLLQYDVGRGNLRQAVIVTSPEPPSLPDNVSDGDIVGLVEELLNFPGDLPDPIDPDVPLFCCVFLPPGTRQEHASKAAGAHFWGVFSGFPAVFSSRVAWVGNGAIAGMTKTFGHELAETCTNPDGGGWMDDTQDEDHPAEIGDICNMSSASVDGVTMEAYWSNEDHACILLTRFSVRRIFRHRPEFRASHSLRTTVPFLRSVRAKIDHTLDVSLIF